MIILKSPEEIEKMRKASRIVAEVIAEVSELIRPGATTQDLDRFAAERMAKKGAKPAFKGYRGFPCVLCTSVNEEVVHGIPSAKKVLKEGDIIGVDCGVVIEGYYGDAAKTFAVGRVDAESQRLMDITRESLEHGIQKMKVDGRIGDISRAVQEHVEKAGFSVVRDFVGHGIGRSLHEEPQVPNYGKANTGIRLSVGMVLAIEPMVNQGSPDVKVLDDGWTAVTSDARRSAHFEHTIALTSKGLEILSVV
jgi:methionyl aminopeptidase